MIGSDVLLPVMTASRSLYESPNQYAHAATRDHWLAEVGGSAGDVPMSRSRPVRSRAVTASLSQSARSCSELDFGLCEIAARRELERCGDDDCAEDCAVGGRACAACRSACSRGYDEAMDACQEAWLCAAPGDCMADALELATTYCCNPGLVPCRGNCVAKCGPEQRMNDICQCVCPDGLTKCGDWCVDPRNDRSNCGACGVPCAPGEMCCDGNCRPCEDSSCCGSCTNKCIGDQQCCNVGGVLSCKPIFGDRSCGACDNDCTTIGKICGILWDMPQCVCPSGSVDCLGNCCEGHCCNGICKTYEELKTDPKNCGNCGIVCTGGSVCKDGKCVCPASAPLCGNQCCACCDGTTCITPEDMKKSLKHCGKCNRPCDNPATQLCCDGEIVEKLTDAKNCGNCGIPCAAGLICKAGVCTCPDGLTLCGSECVDLKSNPQHCGACFHNCAIFACEHGRCVCGTLPKCGDDACCPTARAPSCAIAPNGAQFCCPTGFTHVEFVGGIPKCVA